MGIHQNPETHAQPSAVPGNSSHSVYMGQRPEEAWNGCWPNTQKSELYTCLLGLSTHSMLTSRKLKFYSSFPSVKIWLIMPILLHQNTDFKDPQKEGMSDNYLTRDRRAVPREGLLKWPQLGVWWWSSPLQVLGDRLHRCFMDLDSTCPTV